VFCQRDRVSFLFFSSRFVSFPVFLLFSSLRFNSIQRNLIGDFAEQITTARITANNTISLEIEIDVSWSGDSHFVQVSPSGH
jgi:hypothetical protein